MNRRSFLKTLVGGVAVAAAARTFPFRVYSFPSEIKIAPVAGVDYYSIEWPVVKRTWQFGVYTEEVLRHHVPMIKRFLVPDASLDLYPRFPQIEAPK